MFWNEMQEMWATLRRMSVKEFLAQGVSLGLIVTSALMIWKSLMLITGSESPVVVVLSGSMEPAFYRGDILFLNMGHAPVDTGEIVVFTIDGRDVPIVHRAIQGDNNYGDDRALYARGQRWLQREHVMGRAVGFLPYVGMVTILMNDYPFMKVVLIGSLGLLVLTSKE